MFVLNEPGEVEITLRQFKTRSFQVLSLDETAIDTGKLAESEVLVRWLAAPINPSDLSQISGGYATNPSAFPATPGNEAAGVVEKVSLPDVSATI